MLASRILQAEEDPDIQEESNMFSNMSVEFARLGQIENSNKIR